MVAKFIAEEGPLTGLVLTLDDGDAWIVGRDPSECDIILDDSKVSRKHFICRKVQEEYVLQNLSETNPVFVNEDQVVESHSLREGDRVKVGDSWFRFVIEKEAETRAKDQYDDIFDDEESHKGEEETEEEFQAAKEAKEGLSDEEALKADEEEVDTQYDTIFNDSEDAFDGFTNINEDFAEGARWVLKVLAGPNTGAEFAMAGGKSYVIGKDVASCDILFHDLSVSRNHAKLTISSDGVVAIEDLGSRNGIIIDGLPVPDRRELTSQNLVTLGTTTFVVIDREAQSETIVSIPHPIESKVEKKSTEEAPVHEKVVDKKEQEVEEETIRIGKYQVSPGNFIITGILAAVILVIGIGIVTLFSSKEPSAVTHLDSGKNIQEVIKDFPDIQYTYNSQTGILFILGHVSTSVDKEQLLYYLNALKFIKKIDDNVVVDEYVWREMNQVLARHIAWRGVSIHAPVPGRFVLSGYLATREQGAELSDYVSINFPYIDRLINHVVIEENLYQDILSQLQNQALNNVNIELSNGLVTLTGYIGVSQKDTFYKVLRQLKKAPGVRQVNDYVIITSEEGYSNARTLQGYQITGYAAHDDLNMSIVINGQILTVGSQLNEMVIIAIENDEIYLEKNGLKYKIDYNR